MAAARSAPWTPGSRAWALGRSPGGGRVRAPHCTCRKPSLSHLSSKARGWPNGASSRDPSPPTDDPSPMRTPQASRPPAAAATGPTWLGGFCTATANTCAHSAGHTRGHVGPPTAPRARTRFLPQPRRTASTRPRAAHRPVPAAAAPQAKRPRRTQRLQLGQRMPRQCAQAPATARPAGQCGDIAHAPPPHGPPASHGDVGRRAGAPRRAP